MNLRTSHPHLKMIIVLDGLYADAPLIKLLNELKFRYIITAKKKDLNYLFEYYKVSLKGEVKTREGKDKKETGLYYRNKLPLNDEKNEVKYLQCNG